MCSLVDNTQCFPCQVWTQGMPVNPEIGPNFLYRKLEIPEVNKYPYTNAMFGNGFIAALIQASIP